MPEVTKSRQHFIGSGGCGEAIFFLVLLDIDVPNWGSKLHKI